MKMTTEEAFVKVLQQHGIEHAFGIIGSAFMPISDLFTRAGITFWDVAHETNGGLICDGYTRSTGKIAMAIAQNGPGVTGFVTAIKTAYWNHTPMLLVTPQAANKTIGQGGFQEVEQMALFKDMVAYQEEVLSGIRSGEADVGILLGDDLVEGMQMRLIGRQRCVIYAAPDHALAGRRAIPPAEIAAQDFVGPPARSMFGRSMAKLLGRAGIAPLRVVAETTEFGMSREFTAAGLGLCCSLYASVAGDLAAGRVVALDVDAPPLFIDILQVTHARRADAYAVRQFSNYVADAGAAWA